LSQLKAPRSNTPPHTLDRLVYLTVLASLDTKRNRWALIYAPGFYASLTNCRTKTLQSLQPSSQPEGQWHISSDFKYRRTSGSSIIDRPKDLACIRVTKNNSKLAYNPPSPFVTSFDLLKARLSKRIQLAFGGNHKTRSLSSSPTLATLHLNARLRERRKRYQFDQLANRTRPNPFTTPIVAPSLRNQHLYIILYSV